MASQLTKKIKIPNSGKYIVAVSGGVDSMVLLDILAKAKNLDLVVAHLDHGIRSDSAKDKHLAEDTAAIYKLPFTSKKVRLGRGASEAEAREARYSFLFKILEKENAQGIITAHHLDDRIETSLFNALRGSGTLGLLGVRPSKNIYRPLLGVSKDQLLAYAKQHKLNWREDTTNQDLAYARNFIRQLFVPTLSNIIPGFQEKYLENIRFLQEEYKKELRSLKSFMDHTQVSSSSITFERYYLSMEPKEVQLAILRNLIRTMNKDLEVSTQNLEELRRFTLAAETGRIFKLAPLLAKTSYDSVSLQIK